MELRRILMVDIYETKNYLNSEYFSLYATVNSRIYYLFHDFDLDAEFEFYLNFDMLTYLPFEKIGYEYLNNKLKIENSNVVEFKYCKILKKLSNFKLNADEELKNNIKYFLNNYYKINLLSYLEHINN